MSDPVFRAKCAKYRFDVELGNQRLWYAASPNVKGLLVAERTLEECLSEIVPTLERMALVRKLEMS
jgi:hypothetical protein